MKDIFESITELKDLADTPINLELKVPDEMPKYVPIGDLYDMRASSLDMTKELLLRSAYIKMGMWGFVSWRWVLPLKDWIGNRKCLEIMAGRGWLSCALESQGVDIIATDDFSWHREQFPEWNDTMTDVVNMDAVKSVKKYGADVDIVLVSWPTSDDSTYKVLKELNKVNPKALFVFIGELDSAISASDDFFDHFLEMEDVKFEKAADAYQRWVTYKDGMYLGKYSAADDY
ncbi:hypothetical protein ABEX78_21705 [Priestia megaterium]